MIDAHSDLWFDLRGIPRGVAVKLIGQSCGAITAGAIGTRTRIMNRLHALRRQLLAGGATSLTAAATALLRGYRATSAVDPIRVGLCRDLIADIRRLDDQLAANEKQMTETSTSTAPACARSRGSVR